MRIIRSFQFLLVLCLLLLVSSCARTSGVPPSSQVPDVMNTSAPPTPTEEQASFPEPPPIDYERFSGSGNSELSFPTGDLPLEFVLTTLGGTQSIIQTSADRDHESIMLLNSPSIAESDAGITSIEVDGDEVLVHIEAPGEWTLNVGNFTDDHFLPVPGGVRGSTAQTILIDSPDAKWLHISWAEDQAVISISILDGGEMVDRYFATSQPYNDWRLLPEGAIALYITAEGEWELQLANSKPSSG